MKKAKKKSSKSHIRMTWTIKPVTKIKESDKKYNRAKEKTKEDS